MKCEKCGNTNINDLRRISGFGDSRLFCDYRKFDCAKDYLDYLKPFQEELALAQAQAEQEAEDWLNGQV